MSSEIDRFDQQNQHYGLTKQLWRAQNAAHFEFSVFATDILVSVGDRPGRAALSRLGRRLRTLDFPEFVKNFVQTIVQTTKNIRATLPRG
jgi:hypothetical protein